jgi:hypothetical protein
VAPFIEAFLASQHHSNFFRAVDDLMETIEIPLTRGLVATVSAEDAEAVMRHRWHAKPGKNTMYAAGWVNGKSAYLHRFLMGATGRFEFVDHIDRNGLNNTRTNLRICTPAENSANSRSRDKKVGRRGVRPTPNGRWDAQIGRDGVLLYLGSFETEHEAGIAYDAAFYAIYGRRYQP